MPLSFKLLPLLLSLSLVWCGGASAAVSGFDAQGGDPKVRVQDDLFLAANGRWLEQTPIPADKPSVGIWTQLRDEADQRVRAIVESLAAQSASRGVEAQIGQYYGAYLDTQAIDKARMRPVQPVLDEIKAIRDRAQLAVFMGRHQGWLGGPVELGIEADYQQPDINRLVVWQSGLGLPDRDYYLKTDDARMAKARDAYRRYLQVLARQAGELRAAQAADRVMALEQQLATLQRPSADLRDPVKNYHPMTVAELGQQAAGFDWSAYFGAAALPSLSQLSGGQPEFLKGAADLLAKAPLEDWKLYLKLHALDALAPTLPKTLRDAHFAFHGTALAGVTTQRPRWQQAVRRVNAALGEAIGQVYVARHFPPEHKQKMLVLVHNLLDAYKRSIDGLSWMSPETKVQARLKLDAYLVKIGYPDRWRDYSGLVVRAGDPVGNLMRAGRFEWEFNAAKADKPVDRTEWGLTPQTVNAYYNPLANEIVFPAAILQPPFYNPQADDAVNYGAIGAVIGHEISHGFDDQGSQFDAHGALRNWWTDADRKAFDALGAQLVAQYNAYEPLPGRKLNGQLTLGENIADLSGLQIAYKAYMHTLGDQPAPVIDGLSGPQRFFMGWAQVWRGKMRDELALQLLTTDPHSPAAFRTNGAAVNHDGFHDAFGTQPGDKLYKSPQARIRIW